MKTRLQRLVTLSAGALALAGSLLTAPAPARAALPGPVPGPIFLIKRPDLVLNGWDVGKMWNPATATTVPAIIVSVKNIGTAAAPATKTQIKINSDGYPPLTYLVDTPALAIGESVPLAVPFSGNVCGFMSFSADATSVAFELSEANNNQAFFIDCLPPPGP